MVNNFVFKYQYKITRVYAVCWRLYIERESDLYNHHVKTKTPPPLSGILVGFYMSKLPRLGNWNWGYGKFETVITRC